MRAGLFFYKSQTILHHMNTNTLSVALKEWHLVIQALLSGQQTVLLRKGGILEANNEFELEHQNFLLYPTFVHQQLNGIKPQWRDRVQQAAQEPDEILIEAYATARHIFEVPSRAAMDQLHDLHVWDAPLLDMRFNYRPEKPLYLVVLQAYKLPVPVKIAGNIAYAGCKSWVPLNEQIDVSGASPVTDCKQIQSVTERIESTFSVRS